MADSDHDHDKREPIKEPTTLWGFVGSFIPRFFRLKAEQRESLAAFAFMAGAIALIAYLIVQRDKSTAEHDALTLRIFESEGEKNRQLQQSEAEKNRLAIADVGKLTLASHTKLAAELGKLELRLGDSNAINQSLTAEVKDLKNTIAGLRKKDMSIEMEFAPMPRLKDSIPARPTDAIGRQGTPSIPQRSRKSRP